MKTVASIAKAVGITAAVAVLMILFTLAALNHEESATAPRATAPRAAQQAAPTESGESAERAHLRHLCENEKYLADRRKFIRLD